jgi:hypothetical protein
MKNRQFHFQLCQARACSTWQKQFITPNAKYDVT